MKGFEERLEKAFATKVSELMTADPVVAHDYETADGWRRRSPTSTTTTCRWSTARGAWPAWSPGPTRSPRWSPTTSRWSGRSPGSTSAPIERNCARLKAELGDGAELCAVVKADGYGHGADACANAALAGGATRLAVATGGRGGEQIGRRFPHVPLLTMGALTAEELDAALAAGSEVAVWREGFRRLRRAPAARAQGTSGPGPRQVRQRHGAARQPRRRARCCALARACAEDPQPRAGRRLDPFRDRRRTRLGLLRRAARSLRARSPRRSRPSSRRSIVHAANSAAVFREPRSHFDMARCGVAVYGLDPFQGDPAERGLAPALVAALLRRRRQALRRRRQRRLRADLEGAGATTWVGVLPIGYGDGVRRGLSNNAEVLVGGRRHPLVGTVSMDNVTIDLGPETEVEPGAEAVLIGAPGRGGDPRRGGRRRLGTINYEVTCGISARVPREHAERERRRARAPTRRAVARRSRAALARAGRRLDRRRRGARRGAGREVVDLDLAVAGDPARGREGDRARGRRARLRALGRVRDLAGGRRRRRLAGRRHRAARRVDRGRPGRARLHRRRDRRAACRAASRSTRTAASPTSSGGVLRAVGERSFAADPLRLLRAARLARRARAWSSTRRRSRLARAEAARAAEPAGERQLAELRQLVGGPDPLRGLAPARRARR